VYPLITHSKNWIKYCA